ncbi:phosphatidylserine decarboxylase [Pedomonas mirosovicensis]|uniref:phosphatidylserine decarboxylase n=1 Tax=Pedomonas mirosovicensis TaxID=2908641 RepID=UPI002167230D|nr:phosphatidylserine decarboxylase [Pedomonas mirosovicensis]MCH8685135.1 phosphatidylserine decarboxylase [Pedomonas mirosovicensis]
MMDFLTKLPPVHPEGRKFAAIAAIITLLFFLFGWTALGWIGVVLTIWVLAFFRDPARVTPVGDDLIISPADGIVCMIAKVAPPVEMGLGAEERTRVSIFMNVFNVHINRTPVSGTVERIVYIPGKFINAELDKASEDNERQMFVIRTDEGVKIGMTQIAGLVARRIVRFVREEDKVAAGERVGLIRFGSRVDVYLPEGVAPQVAVGQTMVAGETVLARMGVSEAIGGVVR